MKGVVNRESVLGLDGCVDICEGESLGVRLFECIFVDGCVGRLHVLEDW